MTHHYNITGMTCGNCVAKVKSELLKLGDVSSADVQLQHPQATISMQKHISLSELQSAIAKAGNYTITMDPTTGSDNDHDQQTATSWFATYKPILLIGAFITGASFLVEIAAGGFDWHRWMQNFMAAFFLVFSFFKLLDIKGFAESYRSYDILAKKWEGWGYLYPFIELALGIAFLVRLDAFITNLATFVVMSISIIGVLQSVLNKRKIRCACLGAVFNLPMSTITIVEDALMIAMSAIALIQML